MWTREVLGAPICTAFGLKGSWKDDGSPNFNWRPGPYPFSDSEDESDDWKHAGPLVHTINEYIRFN